MNPRSDQRWNHVAAALRASGAAVRPDDEELAAPHGFATRVVARARTDGRADAAGLALWRRWAVGGACAALAVLAAATLAPHPDPQPGQFVPVPVFDSADIPNLTSQ